MSFFGVGGNPFATPVGMKIEKSTAETLPSEDWALNMEICDLINHSEEGPRDAMKAIRKRLTAQPKNYTIVMYTLTVLETCVKNCGKRFHTLACNKDFIQELVKLIGPKNDPPAAVQEKVLYLIQSWAEAFRHHPDLSGVSQVYADLKHKGVEFPPSTCENTTPILTPQRSNDSQYPGAHPTSVSPSRRSPAAPFGGEPPATSSGGVTLSPEQKAKLQSELDLVESNAKVLADMLNELSPGKEQRDDLQLLQDLHDTCRAMQKRVVELVGRFNDDLLTADLLRINDDLNNLFVRYDRHMGKNRSAASGGVTSPVKSPQRNPDPPQTSPPKKEDEPPLIDLGDDVPPSEQLASLSIGKKNEDVDFDVFAQSRTTVDGGKQSDVTSEPIPPTSVTAAASSEEPVRDQRLSEFDEMEQWLRENPGPAVQEATPKSGGTREDSVSASEFDRFLAERAAAADNLPTIPAATGSSNMDQTPRSRALVKEDQSEKQLFSL